MKKTLKTLLVVMMVALLVVACVACGETKITVTFKSGDTVVKTVELTNGVSLSASDIPADPTAPEGKEFVGWFNGETKFELGKTEITADVTFTAKFVDAAPQKVAVTFKNGETEVKKVELDKGASLKASDIPEAPQAPAGQEFIGWFNGETKAQVGTEINANVTFEAKFEATDWTVTFKNGETVVATALVAKKGNGKVALADIPELEPEEDSDKVFIGWYNGNDKINDKAIAADTTFVALFVEASDYVGTWFNDEHSLWLVIGSDNKVESSLFYGQKNGEFDTETGAFVVTTYEWYGGDNDTLTLVCVNDTLSVLYKSKDSDGFSQPDQTFTCEKFVSSVNVNLVAVNTNGGDWEFKVVNGLIKQYGTSSGGYGRVVEFNETSATIIWRNKNLQASIENGVWYLENVHFFPAAAVSAKGYKMVETAAENALIHYTLQDGIVTLWRTKEEGNSGDVLSEKFIEVEGTIANDEIITLKIDAETTLKVKVTTWAHFVLQGAEAGTYTGAAGNIVLDGFGSATVGEEDAKAYTLNENVLTVGGVEFTLNLEAKTYVEVNKCIGDWRTSSNKLVITADSVMLYGDWDSDDGWLDEFEGEDISLVNGELKVTINGDEITIIFDAEIGSLIVDGGDFSVEEFKSADTKDAANGTWKAWVNDTEVTFVFSGDLIKVEGSHYVVVTWTDGEEYDFDYNTKFAPTLNNERLNHIAVINGAGGKLSNNRYFFVDNGDGTLTCYPTDNTVCSEDTAFILYREEAFPAEPPAKDPDAFVGEWEGTFGSANVSMSFDGFGKGVWNDGKDQQITYTINASGKLEFSLGGCDHVLTLNGNSITDAALQDDEYPLSGTYTKKVESAAHSCVGTWTGTLFGSNCSIEIKQDGTFTYVNGSDTTSGTWIEEDDKTVTFNAFYYEYKVTLDGKKAGFYDDENTFDWVWMSNVNFTPAPSGGSDELDAFAGTWTGKVGTNNYTVVCDGKGNITINNTNFTYTVGSETISVGVFTVTMNGNGTMHVVYDDGDYQASGDLTKQ